MSESTESLEKALAAKQKGNECFQAKEYEKAAKFYSEAIELCPKEDTEDAAVFHKNRAACWLHLKLYEKALSDSMAALKVVPSDSKALYRLAQAHEGLGNLVDSLKNVRMLLSIDSKNKEATEMAQRLTIALKQRQEKMQSTDGIVSEMFSALSEENLSKGKQIQAAKNFAILSRENAGAERIFQAGGLHRLVVLLDSANSEVVHHILETFVGLCSNHKSRAHSVLQAISFEKISSLIGSSYSLVSTSAVNVLKEALFAFTGEDKRTPRGAETAVVTVDSATVIPVVQTLLLSLLSYDVSAEARDCVSEAIIATIPKVPEVYLKQGCVRSLLDLSASSFLQDSEVELKLPVTDNSQINISLALSALHDIGKEKKAFKDECNSFVLGHLSDREEGSVSTLKALAALAVILQGVPHLGGDLFNEELVLAKTLQLATEEDASCQIVAAEVLTLAATNKDQCQGIISKGLPVLKGLYMSSVEQVRVRALVGLCKLGAVGGGDVNAKSFEEGSLAKLEKICRKLLLNSKDGSRIRRWVVEGMAFLTLDAEAKEALIQDKPALSALLKIAKGSDFTLAFGTASIFVNLTNGYDKPEKQPELEELGRYAGENIPKEHEFDGEDYVKKRIDVLLEAGIVSSLVSLSSSKSKKLHEQIARVFLALTTEVAHRGAIIQQGGAKCLLVLLQDNTEKGKKIASQGLAKIGITSDPRLAFPGQRTLEVVRPLVQLLKSDEGLQQFEGLMALTNLASINDEVRKRILQEGGVPLMESLMFEEHELIRRASTEALCNMIQLEDVRKRFHSDDIERVKLWTLFAGEEDPALAKAAAGGLAQLSYDPELCKKIMQVKSAKEIMKELVTNENKELQHRGLFILANLVAANKEIAAELFEADFLEIVMAFAQGAFDPQLKACADRALKNAVEYGLIMPNPERSK